MKNSRENGLPSGRIAASASLSGPMSRDEIVRVDAEVADRVQDATVRRDLDGQHVAVTVGVGGAVDVDVVRPGIVKG